ncbi:DUF1778 domain-containing protein [Endozoicomonas sp. 4G]|uniref:type II toxin-antitoxin system TacA family antitoxin n=1 Tax=Endozoicomonas sp. 4G TaxID=2872754 RepID=UPI0020788BF3|nr:DUF1778 domain-containing protein [Endozoicomonas sp. 4G]
MATSLPRITARIDPDTKELLAQAAAITGVSSINSFVLSAAIEKARQIIDRKRTLKLSQQDAILLVKALDEEVKPNPRLKQAAQRYKGTDSP